jgi:hypothetical protein
VFTGYKINQKSNRLKTWDADLGELREVFRPETASLFPGFSAVNGLRWQFLRPYFCALTGSFTPQ